jgi:DNA-binding transcriptional regulator GbsR (MarR family)
MHVIQNNGGLPMAIKDIAEATGMSQAHTRVVVNRNLEDFVKISGNIALKTEAVQV